MSEYTIDLALPHCRWWLALIAPFVGWRDCCDWRYLPICRNHSVELVKKDKLSDGWGITTREALHPIIQRLAHGDLHGQGDKETFNRFDCCTPSEWQAFLNTSKHSDQRNIRTFYAMSARITGRGRFLAFDYVRATSLIRWGHHANWVTDEELAFLLSYVAHQVQRDFDGWDQFLHSYILGRTWWFYCANKSETSDSLLNGGNSDKGISYDRYFASLQSDGMPDFDNLPFHMELPILDVPESLSLLSETRENEVKA